MDKRRGERVRDKLRKEVWELLERKIAVMLTYLSVGGGTGVL